ncbi:hypothetical protein FXO37_17536 [Capsicum annuum]|nr:hypothetical protein FXO37_17536 [Capsicum annuum]
MDDYRKSVGERPVVGERRREEQQHLHPLLPPPPLPLSFTEHQSLTYFTQQAIRDQSDTTSKRSVTRSRAKDLQALQALWVKMEYLEDSNMED